MLVLNFMPLVSIGVLASWNSIETSRRDVLKFLKFCVRGKTEAEFSSGVDWRDPESGGISA